jgi:hypothetical protein
MRTAITLHYSPRVTLASGPVAYLLAAGAGVDVAGLRSWELPPRVLAAVLAQRPRLGFKREFTAAFRAEAAAVPRGRARLLRRYGASRGPQRSVLGLGVTGFSLAAGSRRRQGSRRASGVRGSRDRIRRTPSSSRLGARSGNVLTLRYQTACPSRRVRAACLRMLLASGSGRRPCRCGRSCRLAG